MRTLTLFGFVVTLVWSQGVSAQAPPDCSAAGDVQFVCGQRAPEDLVVLPGAQWVVASAFSGSGGIFLIRVGDRTSTLAYPAATAGERPDTKTYAACPGPPDAAAKA